MELVYLPPSLRHFEASPSPAPAPAGQTGAPDHSALEYDLVEALAPRMVADVGAGDARSFFALCRSAKDHDLDGLLYAVEPFAAAETEDARRAAADVVQTRLHASYRGIAYLLAARPEDAHAHFSPGSVDLLRVDAVGLESPLSPLLDLWLPKLRPTGVLLCTGVTHPERPDIEREFAARTAGRGVVFPWANGLGVFRADGASEDEHVLLRLIGEGPARAAELVRFYEYAARHLWLARVIEQRGAGLARKGPK